MPDVSVIMPVYNSADTLAECLESIITQTHANIEIIIVDDGSTDHSVDIIRQDCRIRLLQNGRQGLVAALNTGIRQSTADLLARMDADINTYSHSRFLSDYGLNVVSRGSDGSIMTLAGNVNIGGGGFVPVPDPASLALLILGILELGFAKTRKA